jgi:hypothetical protein
MSDEGVRDGSVPDVSRDFACFSDSSGSDEEPAEERCEMEDEPIEGKEEVQTEEFTSYHHLRVALLETGDIDQIPGIRSIWTSSPRPTDVSDPWLRSWQCRQFSQFNASTIGLK